MNYVPYAVPFFIVAMIVELWYGIARKNNTYRLNDTVGSLMLGTLSQVRRFVALGVAALVYEMVVQHFSLWQLDAGHWGTWVFALVFYDFCYYWLHRLGHERTLLWAAHVAHHQSEDYNLSTALRQTSTGFLFSWIFYIPLFICGVPAEIVVSVGSINLIYQFWVHTRHVPKLGWYEWVFVTPSNHRVHHAQNDAYIDRNYGGIFILWDRLFGTFQEELDGEPCVYGIRGPIKSFSALTALTHIYTYMAKDIWHTKRFSDKFRVLVGRTGWRPEDVTVQYPLPKHDLARFERFDPKVPRLVSVYAFLQLMAVVALGQLLQMSELTYASGCFLALSMLWCATSTGWWLDANPKALLLDASRLLVLSTGVLLPVMAIPSSLRDGVLIYSAVNALLLVVLYFIGKSKAGGSSTARSEAV